MNLHRTFFARHFQYFLRGMRRIYKNYGSLDAFAASVRAGEDSAPAWKLVEEMQKIMSDVNDGATCSQCLPVHLENTALKRINMALRWFVRAICAGRKPCLAARLYQASARLQSASAARPR